MAKWQGTVELSSSTMQYVADLAKTGVYGANVDEVVEGLILDGVRRAIDDGHIKVRLFDEDIDATTQYTESIDFF